MGLKGLIAKRLDAPYEATRSKAWLKLKCRLRQEFVVAGFTDRDKASAEVGSLLLGGRLRPTRQLSAGGKRRHRLGCSDRARAARAACSDRDESLAVHAAPRPEGDGRDKRGRIGSGGPTRKVGDRQADSERRSC